MGIHAAVTRRRVDGAPGPDGWYPEQRLSVEQAVKGFTLGSAYAGYSDSCMGKLAEGYFADLIVLEKDPFTCDPDEIKDIKSSATMVNGSWVLEM